MKLWYRQGSEGCNFALFFSGRTISVLLSSVYTFAIGLYVLKTTGSGLSFAVTLCLQILPTVLLGPFAGILADKLNKKIMIVATDAVSGLIFIVLYFFSAGGLGLLAIYTATLLVSVSQTLYNICVDAAVPSIVSKKNISVLNSTGKIVDSSTAILSPGLGGLLYAALDLRLFILLNGISFFLSALTECMINFRLYAEPTGPKDDPKSRMNLKANFSQGAAYIRKTPWLRHSLINFCIFNFFMALLYSVPLPTILTGVFHLSSGSYGIVQCFAPAGMIAGALLLKKVSEILPYEKLIAVTGVLFSAGIILLGILPAWNPHSASDAVIVYYGFALLCIGLLVSLIDIPFINSFQLDVPEEIRGRTLSISISVVKAITPVGYLLSGGLLSVMPPFFIPLCGGFLLLAIMVLVNRVWFKVRIFTAR